MIDRNPTFPPPRRRVYIERHPRPNYRGRFSLWLALLQLPFVAAAVWLYDKPGHPPGLWITLLLAWPLGLLSLIGLVLGLAALRRPPPHLAGWTGVVLNLLILLPSAWGVALTSRM